MLVVAAAVAVAVIPVAVVSVVVIPVPVAVVVFISVPVAVVVVIPVRCCRFADIGLLVGCHWLLVCLLVGC